jgi:hypothetical protein
MKLLCPACGGEVNFMSKASVFGVCSYCNSTLVCHDKDIENLGKMSEMPQDMSPIQIGTSGTFAKSRFQVVGRQKLNWENGSWNEWYVVYDNGTAGWIADSQGHYMLSFESDAKSALPSREQIRIGQTVVINKINFTVDDVKDVTCVGSQGELPMKALPGRKATSVDLLGPQDEFACIDYSADGLRLYVGKYEEFESLKFMNLREFDGW